MVLLLEKEEQQIKINYRIRYEYVLLLIPLVGIFLSVAIGLATKNLRRVINVSLFKFGSFMLGGLSMYLFLQYNMYDQLLLAIIELIVLSVLWIVVPMYCTYILVYVSDDAKLFSYIQNGYSFDKIQEFEYKQRFLLR